MQYWQVKIPEALRQAIERLIRDEILGYRNPSEFVIEAVRRRIEELRGANRRGP